MKVLRIKDKIDLRELEKYGFCDGYLLIDFDTKLYVKNIKKLLFRIEVVVYKDTREIRIIKWTKRGNFPHYCYRKDEHFKGEEKYIKDLIRAGMVEEVEE
jgi:hypothetical protein